MSLSNKEFYPNIFHPFYIIRSLLFKGILKNSIHLQGKLLDFGCGSKPYKHLFNTDAYIGLDYENKGHSHENEIIDVFYDGNNIPFPDNHFDSILCTEVFEHIFNLDVVLAELTRVLKPGGKILITCPFVWNLHEAPHDFARYTNFALRHLLTKNDLEVVVEEKSGDFISVLFQMKILYFFTVNKKLNSNILLRPFIKLLFVFFPNLLYRTLKLIMPFNDSLYLNNIFVAQKKNA